MLQGRISSIETLGLMDGPGIRFVAFFQGCKLRCKYCHNPETWNIDGDSEIITSEELVARIMRYKNYYGSDGGVTFSGGEPLLQPEFLLDCLKLCREKGIHTCLDTAGVGFGDYREILSHVDLVILDVKAVDESEYKEITGQDIRFFNEFLATLKQSGNKIWLRQVIVPGINDDEEHINALQALADTIPNVDRIELLPYKTIGVHKYKTLKLKYRLDGVEEMDESRLIQLQSLLKK